MRQLFTLASGLGKLRSVTPDCCPCVRWMLISRAWKSASEYACACCPCSRWSAHSAGWSSAAWCETAGRPSNRLGRVRCLARSTSVRSTPVTGALQRWFVPVERFYYFTVTKGTWIQNKEKYHKYWFSWKFEVSLKMISNGSAPV